MFMFKTRAGSLLLYRGWLDRLGWHWNFREKMDDNNDKNNNFIKYNLCLSPFSA